MLTVASVTPLSVLVALHLYVVVALSGMVYSSFIALSAYVVTSVPTALSTNKRKWVTNQTQWVTNQNFY